MTPPSSGTGLVLYAFSLGLVAAVNPCGLPMLPAYLALFTGRPTGSDGARIARSLLAGAGVSGGFVAVFGALGLMVESGVQLVAGWLPWVMIVVGLSMTVAGVLTLAGRAPSLHLPAPRVRPGRSALAMLGYGAAYAIGSLSCSLPLFLAAVGSSFTRRGAWAGLSTYLAYALGMGLFVTAAAVVTTTAGATALRRVRAASRALPVVSGLVLTLSGAYLLYYWLTDLRDPTGSSPVTAAVGHVQTGLTTAVGTDPVRSAVVLGAIVLAAFVVVVRRSLASPVPTPRTAPRKGTADHDRDPAA
ncbi:cytochrome c biogenesis CcdA family protein [Cellulomonas sp. P24]|uniref:cytochrome c biogenesis CcdA family protein n=1 Tax=Cellulomonas sp. P24 TaxID=2885206 RepID=UPI00216AC21C|nr:cytochrome c biogenesis CcdA family protein [Cellulomonas sp. P24]MCR6493219.1 cytochrome c biogenesis CcdA family protein [Cellulomonas sp. P24]